MKNILLNTLLLMLFANMVIAQDNPIILEFLQNHDGAAGSHYVAGNSTPIEDNVLANVQSVDYNVNWVYVSATGIPTYITGPFQDNNPSLATDQDAIYRLPLVPVAASNPTETTAGNIGIFINGVSLFDYRDGVAWNNTTNALCGGPGNPPCPGGPMASQDWNRDAIPAEMAGFDCAKAHPAMGNYHHHQNPSAFNLDLIVVSDVCDAYPADGLYIIEQDAHSPLIGFAYDGFPIYGAYAYANTDGTGGIVRMQSSYELTGATTRVNGPNMSQYEEGYFREDYQYVAHSEDYYLDEHNGRIAITPEYPEGIYCYYATVDANHNSAYPYVVGPTFYGEKTAAKVTSLPNNAVNYDSSVSTAVLDQDEHSLVVYPNPAQDFIAIQSNLLTKNLQLELVNELGQVVLRNEILKGSTLSVMDTNTLYNGIYFLKVSGTDNSKVYKIVISK